MSDDQFSHAFKDVVPEAPSPNAWADGARRRHRRRSQLVAGVVGVAVVALAIPVTLNILRPDVTTMPAQAPTSQVPAGPPSVKLNPAPEGKPGAAACYDADGNPVQPVAGKGVQAGAVRAWLCGDDQQTGPLEPLVTGVDGIVEFVTKQQSLPADQACTMEYTLAYTVVLEYPDGSTVPVASERHGCRKIDDGAVVRGGGEGLFQLVRGLWQQQRLAIGRPEEAFKPTFPSDCVGNTLIKTDLGNVAGGAACLLAAGDFADPVLDFVELSARDAAIIAADIKANAAQGNDPSGGQGPKINLIDVWGSKLDVWTVNPGHYQYMDADGQMWFWTPTAEVQQIIDTAFGNLSAPQSSPGDSPSTTSPTGTTQGPGAAPGSYQPTTRNLALGETVHLPYFDVTVSRYERDADGVEAGVEVSVCYTNAHPEANADGTTRVSRDPWSFGLLDAESGETDYTFYRVNTFEVGKKWLPVYQEKLLKVGQCNTGWVSIANGAPDFWIKYVRYLPADFGDTITWDLTGS